MPGVVRSGIQFPVPARSVAAVSPIYFIFQIVCSRLPLTEFPAVRCDLVGAWPVRSPRMVHSRPDVTYEDHKRVR